MLPSQFQNQMKKEEDLKRRLKGRLELAKYLRDVVEEKAKTIKASDTNSVSFPRDVPHLSFFVHSKSNLLLYSLLLTGIAKERGGSDRIFGSHSKRKSCGWCRSIAIRKVFQR